MQPRLVGRAKCARLPKWQIVERGKVAVHRVSRVVRGVGFLLKLLLTAESRGNGFIFESPITSLQSWHRLRTIVNLSENTRRGF